MKYVAKEAENQAMHWRACEHSRSPYIVVSQEDNEYSRIFFDITNYEVDLDAVSKSIRGIYESYIEFFLIPTDRVSRELDEYYLFSFLVRRNHADLIANQLFDYLEQVFLHKGT